MNLYHFGTFHFGFSSLKRMRRRARGSLFVWDVLSEPPWGCTSCLDYAHLPKFQLKLFFKDFLRTEIRESYKNCVKSKCCLLHLSFAWQGGFGGQIIFSFFTFLQKVASLFLYYFKSYCQPMMSLFNRSSKKSERGIR